MDGKRSRWRTLLTVLLVLAAVPVLVVGAVVVLHKVQQARLRALYAEVAEESLAREYRRAPDPPGWELVEGSAAEQYREAWEGCPTGRLTGPERIGINQPIHALRGEAMTPGIGHPMNPISALPPDCEFLGVVEPDLALSQLQPGVCRLLEDCDAALDLIVGGSRRVDNTSPMSIWSPWSLDDSGTDDPNAIRFTYMAKLLTLRGHTVRLAGDREGWFADTFAAFRMLWDLPRGAGVMGLLGFSSQNMLANTIEATLWDGGLSQAEVERIYRELDYLLSQPVDYGETTEDMVLVDMDWWIDTVDLPTPARQKHRDKRGFGWRRGLAAATYTGEMLRAWSDIWDVQASSWPDRLSVYDRIHAEWPTRPRTGLTIYSPFETTLLFDLRIVLAETRLRLLQLAAADTALRLAGSPAPTTIEDLKAFDPDIPLLDPLSNEPFVLEVIDGRRVLRTAAVDDRERTGFDRLRNFDPEPYLVLELPEGGGGGGGASDASRGGAHRAFGLAGRGHT